MGLDFTRLREYGGITPTDFHRLSNVSRVSCSLWFNGIKDPHPLHRVRIEKIVTALLKAIDAGELPLSEQLSAEDRAIKIKEITLRFL